MPDNRGSKLSRDDLIALRLNRAMGVVLSNEELDAMYAPGGLMPAPPSPQEEEPYDEKKFNASNLLARLLRAAGCYVPESMAGDGEGRAHLIQCAMRKVEELRGRAPSRGSGAAANQNPIIAAAGGVGEIEPMYMSVEGMADANRRLRERMATTEPTPITPERAKEAERALGRYMSGR
jgi:hypothetical protein